MNAFATEHDVIEFLKDELQSTAKFYPNAQEAMLYLADEFARLAPLYEAVCEHIVNEDNERQVLDSFIAARKS